MSVCSRFRLPVFALTALALILGACSHYRLGPPGELPFRTLYVEPAINESYAPQAAALLTDQTITDLQGHGNLKIVELGGADATLKISIQSYERSVGATQQDDTGAAQSYILTMKCRITLIDNRNGGKVLMTRELKANQQAFIQGGFQISEYQAMPVLTREMARQITNAIVSVW